MMQFFLYALIPIAVSCVISLTWVLHDMTKGDNK